MKEFCLESHFNQKIANIFDNNLPDKLIIAVSGGVDSMALLFLSHNFCQKNNINLIAITIDHKIREESKEEAEFVKNICQKFNIKHKILENNYFIPNSNIESNLREIRYDLLSNFAKQNNIKNILIAHHQQDIAENFLIRLFRGSGIDGLSAIDEITKLKNINLIRPLLDITKLQLQEYLQEKNIAHINDKTNDDQKFLRNKIRIFLNDFEDRDIINYRINKASQNILENRKIIENIIIEKANEIYQFNNLGYFLLKKNNFKNLPQELALRYLNLIFNYFNGQFYKARLSKIKNIYNYIILDDKYLAKNFNGTIFEDFDKDNLIFYREKSQIKLYNITKYQFIWDNRFKININKKINLENLEISNMKDSEFNLLLKNSEFDQYKNLKNPLKKIFYTIPVIKLNSKIIAIYQLLNNYDILITCKDNNLN
jgi:tRNA(Ile)-lysidine synthase